MKKQFLAVAGLLFAFGNQGVLAQAYNTDITTADMGDIGVLRLFQTQAGGTTASNAAPMGNSIWFIGDTNNMGLAPIFPGGGLGADDQLIFGDAIPGERFFPPTSGVYERLGVGVTNTFNPATTAIWVVLWDRGVASPGQVQAGFKYGVLNLGLRPPPSGAGNADWTFPTGPSGNIFANQFTVVPEPSIMILSGLGIVGLMIGRRLRKA